MSQTEHRRPDAGIFASGKPFFVGCNYWASHAGTRMWRNWDAASVEADLAALSKAGVQVIRAFPLWPDFQPEDFYEALQWYQKQDVTLGG